MTGAQPHHDSPTPDWDALEEAAEAAGDHGQRRWWLVGALGVAMMTALAIWWGVSATSGRVHWVNTGFEVSSDTEVQVRFDLRRDPSRAVVCRLEAQAKSHVVVGRTEVEVPPGSVSPSRHVETVQTASPAITGYADQCWYADEAPRP